MMESKSSDVEYDGKHSNTYSATQSATYSAEQSTASAKSQYADIITLPHHKAANRKQMSMMERAAQFSPYAALVGFDGVIAETGRLTDRKIELSETEKAMLDRKLAVLEEQLKDANKANAYRTQYTALPQYTAHPQHTDPLWQTNCQHHTLLPHITVRYFVPDDLKAGGSYQQYTGRLKKIDRVERALVLVEDGREEQNSERFDGKGTARHTKTIPIDDVLEISGGVVDCTWDE